MLLCTKSLLKIIKDDLLCSVTMALLYSSSPFNGHIKEILNDLEAEETYLALKKKFLGCSDPSYPTMINVLLNNPTFNFDTYSITVNSWGSTEDSSQDAMMVNL